MSKYRPVLDRESPRSFTVGIYTKAGRRVGSVGVDKATLRHRKYMRVDDVDGPDDAVVAGLRYAARVACSKYKLPLGSDPVRPETEERVWSLFASKGSARCMGRLPENVAESWDLPRGRCATWLLSCSINTLEGAKKKRRRRR